MSGLELSDLSPPIATLGKDAVLPEEGIKDIDEGVDEGVMNAGGAADAIRALDEVAMAKGADAVVRGTSRMAATAYDGGASASNRYRQE